MSDSNCCSEPESYAAVEEDGTSGLVIEVFDDFDEVGADVVLLHSCPQSCMPIPVEGLLEVYEDMAEVLLVLEMLLTFFRVSNKQGPCLTAMKENGGDKRLEQLELSCKVDGVASPGPLLHKQVPQSGHRCYC